MIDISPTSDQYINPMDITLNYSEDDNPLTLKSDFILSLMELIVGGKAGLEPVEKTVVDRCVHMVYREYLQDPRPEKMPVLGTSTRFSASSRSRRPSGLPRRWKFTFPAV